MKNAGLVVALLGMFGCATADNSTDSSEEQSEAAISARRCGETPGMIYSYVSRSKQECALIHFLCPIDTEYFANKCGCGCVEATACTLEECGPAPAAPTTLCPDGINVSGPGPCERAADGTCGYSWLTCP